MKLSEIYSRNVEEKLNAVVSTGDLDAQTVKTEIDEYVFTVDIVNGLYKTLSAMKNGSVNHNGVWVSGYFGSGKSHFLKFVNYCLRNQGAALERAEKAVAEHDPLTSGGKSNVTPSEWKSVSDWLVANAHSVHTIMFNMGVAGDSNSKEGDEFLTVFWRKFNEMRGYNGSDLALAYYLELPLDKAGKFEAFKAKIAEAGFDWTKDGVTIAGTMLDTALDAAKAVMPNLTIDAVRENIIHQRVPLTVENFMADVKEWLDGQDANCRLVFCADEISQYINNRGSLLLQLQEIVTAFHNKCGAKVWLVCTAQQDISEITTASGFNKASEEFGKIMGRFPVMVQLSAASTEYITRKRVLDKKPNAAIELGNFYDKNATAIGAQYELPTAYRAYSDRADFVDTYPFLGCHFKLVGQILRSFRDQNFVVQNVKDNARSVLGVTLDVARSTGNCEVGKFVAIDEFFSQMFADGLTAIAFSVLQNPRDLAAKRDDPEFANRVVNTLFMVCHLAPKDALAFPATLDNLTSLMMTDLSTSRKALKEKIQAEVDYLCGESVLLKETADSGLEYYKFYSKTESQIDSHIKSITPGEGDLAETWAELVSECLGSSLKPKTSFHAAKLSVGMDILGRQMLNHNADVNVNLRVNSGGIPVEQIALTNPDTSLVFFLNDLYNGDAQFRDALDAYCKFNMFSRQNALNTQEEKVAFEKFQDRAKKLRSLSLLPTVRKFLVDAPLVSGTAIITVSEKSTAAKRYEAALEKHLERLYPNAVLADSLPKNAAGLAADIQSKQSVLPGTPLSPVEKCVEDYLDGMPSPQPAKDVVDYFCKRPYGWDEFATLAVMARLVASERREFIYNGAPNPDAAVVAANLAKNTANFSIASRAAIPKQTIDAFVEAMRQVFGHATLQDASQTAAKLFVAAKEIISEKIDKMNAVRGTTGQRPFVVPMDDLIKKFTTWRQIADIKAFFEAVKADASTAAGEWDFAKEIINFVEGSQWQRYLGLIDFAVENAENVQFLDDGGKANFGYLVVAKDDMKPWQQLPKWIQIKKQTEAAITACRAQKEAQIDTAYSAAFDELEAQAASLGVDKAKFADRATTVAAKKAGNSLMSLENAINSVGNFKSAELAKIITVSTPVAENPVKLVKLNVTSSAPLKDEAGVDAYLGGLKAQLMAEISAGASVIVQ